MSTSALHFTTLFDVGTGLPVGFDDAQTPVVADSPAASPVLLAAMNRGIVHPRYPDGLGIWEM